MPVMFALIRLSVLSLLLLHPHLVVHAKDGIIGFGIPLYQDLCCQACHDSLSTLYLTCTTFPDNDTMSDGGDMGMGGDISMMGTTSDECYATNRAWLETMAYCIQQRCTAVMYPADKQAACFTAQAVAGAATPTFEDSLPASPPTAELADNATWLNVTSLVNGDVYYATYGTLGEFARSEYFHTRYSVILYLLAIGVCITCGVFAQVVSLLPSLQRRLNASAPWRKFRQHLALPALLGTRHLEPLPAQLGYVPSRALSLSIGAYVALNIIFCAVSFRSFQPNVWFLSRGFELCEYVGNRSGTLSLVNLSIAILFAGRNNALIALTGWSQTTFMTLHRWTARVAAVQAVVHSIVYTLAYFEPGYDGASAYAAKAAEPFYWWGIIATIAMCLAASLAFLPLRTRFYESFLATHIAFAILTLVGLWYHLVPHFGFDYGYQVWLYIAFAFWGADRLARLGRVAYYSRLGGSRAVAEAVPGCDVVQVTLFPRAASGFGPAQHSFLYFAGSRFWESHPFSVAGWSSKGHAPPPPHDNNGIDANGDSESQVVVTKNDKPSVQFLIRARAGMTSRLRQRVLDKGTGPSSALELGVYTEGPYAGHAATLCPLFAADTILCVAGGIGITHILGLIQEYRRQSDARAAGGEQREGETLESRKSRRRTFRASRLVLAWSAREMGLLRHVKQNFLRDYKGAEYRFWCTGTSHPAAGDKGEAINAGGFDLEVTAGRMDIGAVLRSCVEPGRQMAVLACAPGGMMDQVTVQVVRCVRDGLGVELVKEAFAW